MGHTFNLSDNNANGVAGSVRTRATWINLAMTTLPADTVHATISELVRAYLAADYRWQHDGDWHELHIGLQAPALELLYPDRGTRSAEHTSELQSLMRTSYAVFCLKKKNNKTQQQRR